MSLCGLFYHHIYLCPAFQDIEIYIQLIWAKGCSLQWGSNRPSSIWCWMNMRSSSWEIRAVHGGRTWECIHPHKSWSELDYQISTMVWKDITYHFFQLNLHSTNSISTPIRDNSASKAPAGHRPTSLGAPGNCHHRTGRRDPHHGTNWNKVFFSKFTFDTWFWS